MCADWQSAAAVVDDQPTSEPEAQGWGVGPRVRPPVVGGAARRKGMRGVGRYGQASAGPLSP